MTKTESRHLTAYKESVYTVQQLVCIRKKLMFKCMYSILRLGFLAGVNGHSFMLIFLFSFPYTVYVFDNVHRVCIVFTRNHETSHASPLQRPSMDCSCLGPYPSVCFSQYIYSPISSLCVLSSPCLLRFLLRFSKKQ